MTSNNSRLCKGFLPKANWTSCVTSLWSHALTAASRCDAEDKIVVDTNISSFCLEVGTMFRGSSTEPSKAWLMTPGQGAYVIARFLKAWPCSCKWRSGQRRNLHAQRTSLNQSMSLSQCLSQTYWFFIFPLFIRRSGRYACWSLIQSLPVIHIKKIASVPHAKTKGNLDWSFKSNLVGYLEF